MLPLWLLWTLRVVFVGVFGILIYLLVTAPRRGTGLSAEFTPGREGFVMPDGTGSRLGDPRNIGVPGIGTGPTGMSTEYWPGQSSNEGTVDLTIRPRRGPWIDVALEMSEDDDSGPGSGGTGS